MKITKRIFADYEATWEIDFSRELTLYDLDDADQPTIEHGICVPVIPSESSSNNETYFWDSYIDVVVIVDYDRYTLNKDNPKEYARLVNNLEALFALHRLK